MSLQSQNKLQQTQKHQQRMMSQEDIIAENILKRAEIARIARQLKTKLFKAGLKVLETQGKSPIPDPESSTTLSHKSIESNQIHKNLNENIRSDDLNDDSRSPNSSTFSTSPINEQIKTDFTDPSTSNSTPYVYSNRNNHNNNNSSPYYHKDHVSAQNYTNAMVNNLTRPLQTASSSSSENMKSSRKLDDIKTRIGNNGNGSINNSSKIHREQNEDNEVETEMESPIKKRKSIVFARSQSTKSISSALQRPSEMKRFASSDNLSQDLSFSSRYDTTSSLNGSPMRKPNMLTNNLASSPIYNNTATPKQRVIKLTKTTQLPTSSNYRSMDHEEEDTTKEDDGDSTINEENTTSDTTKSNYKYSKSMENKKETMDRKIANSTGITHFGADDEDDAEEEKSNPIEPPKTPTLSSRKLTKVSSSSQKQTTNGNTLAVPSTPKSKIVSTKDFKTPTTNSRYINDNEEGADLLLYLSNSPAVPTRDRDSYGFQMLPTTPKAGSTGLHISGTPQIPFDSTPPRSVLPPLPFSTPSVSLEKLSASTPDVSSTFIGSSSLDKSKNNSSYSKSNNITGTPQQVSNTSNGIKLNVPATPNNSLSRNRALGYNAQTPGFSMSDYVNFFTPSPRLLGTPDVSLHFSKSSNIFGFSKDLNSVAGNPKNPEDHIL